MLLRFYVVSAIICAISLIVLMMSPSERENFFLTRWFIRRFFSRLDFHQRQQRISQIFGVILTAFAIGAMVAFIIVRMNRR